MADETHPGSQKRVYHSPTRQRQVEETRQRMLATSRALFLRYGYAGTTVEAIAQEADVSPKTVTAAFGSKRGILVELLSPEAFGSQFQETMKQLRVDSNPYQRINFVAQMSRQVYETLTSEFDLLRGAATIAPELADISQSVEERRWRLQQRFIEFIAEYGVLRADLSHAQATDTVWTLTSFDLYRRLIIERGWSAAQYEDWLTQTLKQQLLRS